MSFFDNWKSIICIDNFFSSHRSKTIAGSGEFHDPLTLLNNNQQKAITRLVKFRISFFTD
jgi:hypothetical protein